MATMRSIWSNTSSVNMIEASRKPLVPRGIKAPGLLNGKKVLGLVDTGASHSLINAGVATRLGLSAAPCEAVISVVTADGTSCLRHLLGPRTRPGCPRREARVACWSIPVAL